MATQADFGWELPDLSDVADGPDAFLQFADDIAATVKDRGLTTYTPSWTSDNAGAQPTNPSKREGFYRIDNGICQFSAHIFFGASTSGGLGRLYIGLPVPASPLIATQTAIVHLWTPAANAVWFGPAFIDVQSNWQRARPYFPVHNGRSDLLPWASGGGDFGLSVPSIPANPGNWSVMNGGDVSINGSYFIA